MQVLDCELAMKMTSYDDDDVDDGEEDPEDDAEEERTCLAEAIDSLLDVKPELTPAWAESVRQILRSTDMSSSASSSSSSGSSGSADPASHTPARTRHDQHHDKVVAGLEGWCLSHSCFSCPFSATNLKVSHSFFLLCPFSTNTVWWLRKLFQFSFQRSTRDNNQQRIATSMVLMEIGPRVSSFSLK